MTWRTTFRLYWADDNRWLDVPVDHDGDDSLDELCGWAMEALPDDYDGSTIRYELTKNEEI